MKITTQNYAKLLLDIRQTVKQTEENLVASVNYEKVKMSWRIGEKIEKFLSDNLKPSERSNYGKKLITKLSKDVEINHVSLYQMHAFYKTYKTLPSPQSKLNWTHYRNLISVKDDTKRQLLEDLVTKNELSAKKLQREVSVVNKKPKRKERVQTKLRCTRGQLFTYTVTKEKKIDLGFNVFLSSGSPLNKKNFDSRMVKKDKSDYAYLARLERVVDGDTLHVVLDLGFGVEHREILRLSQIDAAEADTFEGKKSTQGLQNILRRVKFLVVRTSKTDTYGRYIADVFFGKKESAPQAVAKSGVFLNQLLLDRGLVGVWGV